MSWETVSEYFDWRLLSIVALVVWILLRKKTKQAYERRYRTQEEQDESDALEARLEERRRQVAEERKRRAQGADKNE